jgi:hypothetical protein
VIVILWLLQHAALLVVWLIAHLPGWAWLVLLGLFGLSLLRSAPLLAVLGLVGGYRAGRGVIRNSHGNPQMVLVVVVVACAIIGHALGMGDGGPPAPAAANPVLTSVTGPGTVYTYGQLTQALEATGTGMYEGNARIGAAVAEAESGGRSNALCDSCAGTREFSVGPWQINLYAHPDVTESCAQDLTCAAAAAARISDRGLDWSAWSTYTSRAYLEHMEPAS